MQFKIMCKKKTLRSFLSTADPKVFKVFQKGKFLLPTPSWSRTFHFFSQVKLYGEKTI
jgi:hypothetical protein